MDDHMKVHNEKAMDRHGLAGHMDRMVGTCFIFFYIFVLGHVVCATSVSF